MNDLGVFAITGVLGVFLVTLIVQGLAKANKRVRSWRYTRKRTHILCIKCTECVWKQLLADASKQQVSLSEICSRRLDPSGRGENKTHNFKQQRESNRQLEIE